MSRPIVTVAIIIATCLVNVRAQDLSDPWGKFQTQTMNELIANAASSVAPFDGTTVLITTQFLPSKVKLTYAGKSRKASSETKSFVQQWVKTVAHHPRLLKLFDKEMLFTDGSSQYWLPVPNNGPNYGRAIHANEQVILYITVIGIQRSADETRCFFVVNNFERG